MFKDTRPKDLTAQDLSVMGLREGRVLFEDNKDPDAVVSRTLDFLAAEKKKRAELMQVAKKATPPATS